MIKLSRKIVASVCMMGCVYSNAQTTFYVEGLGRAQVSSDQLSGSTLLSDTLKNPISNKLEKRVETKGTGGYTLLDLGINLEKKEKFMLNTILRGRSPFGLFWGEGTSFNFRKITMSGLIGGGVRYDIGDIHHEMTPYTLYMPDAEYHAFESDIFGMRRSIVQYENFIEGNKRFQQGAKIDGTLMFTKVISRLHMSAFASRNRSIDNVNGGPDVIMSGFQADAIQGKYGSLSLNLVSLFDLPVAINKFGVNTTVFTTGIKPIFVKNDKMDIGLNAELGTSSYLYDDFTKDPKNETFGGFFYDTKGYLHLKSIKTTLNLGYKMVPLEFRSPGAQSRRINDAATTQFFSTVALSATGAELSRNYTLFDRFSQENMYQQGVRYILDDFNPIYNNANPYGDATPNRQGLVFDVNHGDNKSPLSVQLKTQMLNEIDPDGNQENEKRNFLGLQSGISLGIHKLVDWKKEVKIGGGYQLENTSRAGDKDKISLNSNIIDAFVSAEVIEKFHLMLGYKHFTVKGNEVYRNIDVTTNLVESNTVPTYINDLDFNTSLLSLGAALKFTDKSSLNLHYTTNSNTNNFVKNSDYVWNQLFINYTMKF